MSGKGTAFWLLTAAAAAEGESESLLFVGVGDGLWEGDPAGLAGVLLVLVEHWRCYQRCHGLSASQQAAGCS